MTVDYVLVWVDEPAAFADQVSLVMVVIGIAGERVAIRRTSCAGWAVPQDCGDT